MRSKFLLAALAAVLVVAFGAGTASASRGVRNSATSLRATATSLVFTDEAQTSSITCEVILTISLHATVAKSRGTLAGLVTAVTVQNCRGGTATVLTATLPWHITYDEFRGTLPSEIRGVRLQLNGAAFLLSAVFGIARCLYRGNAQGIAEGARNELRTLAAAEEVELPLFDQSLSFAECPRNGRFRGTFTLSATDRLTLI